MRTATLHWFPALAALLILAQGCATEPGPAELMRVGPQAAANREAQTRRFNDVSESELLAACVSVLQDQGFRITTSEGRLGVITGSKPRSVEDIFADLGRQSLLAGVTFGLHPDIAMGPAQGFGVVLATRNVGGLARSHEVRVTFYLMWGVRDPHSPDKPLSARAITTPTLYQQFFGMLGTTLARSRAGS
ncbi:MAG TPA: hypothetical protein VLC73_06415 [Burkholderiales bacterium]|nr:hypothetical protein [Burkholderiales bacterium]